ncbi:MAG: hypothetical protein JSV44_02640 [Candidatus Zixiibacteriota bacterium]|nr:MAG: hypothetical protein JSV44_02640 [candidate division Zixibacteria bacterium]
MPVTNGLFSVLLGSLAHHDESLFSDTLRYLNIKVGEGPEISPRSQHLTSPYAFRAGTIDGSSGGTISGNVGIDVANPDGMLDVAGQSTFRRKDGIQDKIGLGVGNPDVAPGLRSGTTGGTPCIDFENNNVNDARSVAISPN